MGTVVATQYGAFLYGGIRYNEAAQYDTGADFAEGRYGLGVQIYEPYVGGRKAIYDSGQGYCPLNKVEFAFEESGCAAFKLNFNTGPENLAIRRGDRVDIHLFSSILPWFSGRISEIPGVDTASGATVYSGHGYFDVLNNIRVTETYTNKTIEYIVRHLSETYLPHTDVQFFADQLPVTGYTAQSVEFDRVTMKEALSKLADLAHDYIFGVDENRVLFFVPREGRPIGRYVNKASHWVGRHLEAFSLTEKSDSVANRLFVKMGSISDGSNFADFTVEDLDSIAFFGEKAAVVSAPELKSEADAQTWAEYEVETKAWPKITGKGKNLDLAKWVTGKEDLLRAEGSLRVSMLRSGIVAPYHEPLNGYFRWQNLGRVAVYSANWVKRDFSPRKAGKLGPVEFFIKKTGSPGDFTVRLKKGSTVLATATVDADAIPSWQGWVLADLGGVSVSPAYTYTLEVYEGAGDASNYYSLLYSTQDATFEGAFYLSADSGSSWTEDTAKGLVYRAYLVHQDEFVLAIKKVRYQASPDGGISADIDLGELDRPLEEKFMELLRGMRAEALLAQSNVKDLS